MKWLHLSDLHVHAARSTSQRAAWQSFLAYFQNLSFGNLDFVIVTGDLSYSGDAEEFKLFAAFVAELRALLQRPCPPIILAPGNHDINRTIAGC